MLARNPGSSAVVIIALALGLGAATAIFSFTEVVLLRPLAIPDLDRIVALSGASKDAPRETDTLAPADFLDYQARARSLEHVAAIQEASFNVTGGGTPERVEGYRVSAAFFPALGVTPLFGRVFAEQEDVPGSDRVVVLGYLFWQRRFGGDRSIAGRTIILNGNTYQVLGVMPESFRYPADSDLWLPIALSPERRAVRGPKSLSAIARLKPGVTVAEANAEIRALSEQIAAAHPETHGTRRARLFPLADVVTGDQGAPFIRMVMVSSLILLLIACANVATLQFARMSARSREIAVRAALGATRLRLIGQFLSESVILALFACAAGLVFAAWGIDLMKNALPPDVQVYVPEWHRLGLNWYVLGFALFATCAAGILSGIAPAVIASRVDVHTGLKEGSRSSSTRRRHRARNGMIVIEVTLALVLLVAAALMTKGIRSVVEPADNLDPGHVLTMRLALPERDYPKSEDRTRFQQTLLERARALPAVTHAAVINVMPYGGGGHSVDLRLAAEGPAARVNYRSISTGYFSLMRIPVLTGRSLTAADHSGALPVAVVSRSLASRLFGAGDPIGKRVRIGARNSTEPWLTIVGVCGDILHTPMLGTLPTIYVSNLQAGRPTFDVLLRTSGDPSQLAAAARAAVMDVDPNQPVYKLATLADRFTSQTAGLQFLAALMGVSGVLALVLATVGVYSLMAYTVEERSHEMGVRIAVGARPADVLRLIVQGGLKITGIGIAAGSALAYALARVLAHLFVGVSSTDLTVFMFGIGLLTAAVLLASIPPARRAARNDPMTTLMRQ